VQAITFGQRTRRRRSRPEHRRTGRGGVPEDASAAWPPPRWEAFKGGDVGSAPVIVGVIAITISSPRRAASSSPGQLLEPDPADGGVTVIAGSSSLLIARSTSDRLRQRPRGRDRRQLQVPARATTTRSLIALAAIGAGAAIGALQGNVRRFDRRALLRGHPGRECSSGGA
jgi:hypothetical protein